MFITLAREDTIRVAPQFLCTADIKSVLADEIDLKYSDTVLPGHGLVICLWAIDEIREATVMPGDGGAFTFVKFRLLVFAPEVGELVLARVKAVDPVGGVRCSVDFFDDIVIPPAQLPERATFVAQERTRCWKFDFGGGGGAEEGGAGEVDLHVRDLVRLRVTNVTYRAAKSDSSSSVESGAGGAGASAGPDSAYQLGAVPAQIKSLRRGFIIAGAAVTDGATLPTPSSIITTPGVGAVGSVAGAAGAGKPAAGVVGAGATAAAAAAAKAARSGPEVHLPPSYSYLPHLPPAHAVVAAASVPAEVRVKTVAASSALLFPPLTQALTAASSSAWRVEGGASAGGSGAGGGIAASASASAEALANGMGPTLTRGTVGVTEAVQGPGTADAFYSREATQMLLPVAPSLASAAAGGPASLLSAFIRARPRASTSVLLPGGLPGSGPGGAGSAEGPAPAPYAAPMVVVGSIQGTGLGPLGWWEEGDPEYAGGNCVARAAAAYGLVRAPEPRAARGDRKEKKGAEGDGQAELEACDGADAGAAAAALPANSDAAGGAEAPSGAAAVAQDEGASSAAAPGGSQAPPPAKRSRRGSEAVGAGTDRSAEAAAEPAGRGAGSRRG